MTKNLRKHLAFFLVLTMILLGMAMVTLAGTGCTPTQWEQTETATEAVEETGRQLQKVASESPTLNGLTGGMLPLAGELLILLGGAAGTVIQTIRRNEAESTLDEVDKNTSTLSLSEQVKTSKGQKVAKRIASK